MSWAGGGGSRCSPGEFLTVFSLLTCPGELDVSGGNSGRRQDLSGGVSFIGRDGSFCPGEFLAIDQTFPGEFLSVVVRGVSDSILIFMWLFNLS